MRIKLGNIQAAETGNLIIKNWDKPAINIKTTDTDPDFTNGTIPGTDTLGTTTWVFTLNTNTDNLTQAQALADSVFAVWRDSSSLGAGELTRLEYQLEPGLPWMTVWGRARKISSSVPGVRERLGVIQIVGEFLVADPVTYSSQSFSVDIASQRPNIPFGFVFPAQFPIVMAGDEKAASRSVEVDAAGAIPSPVVIRINGPVAKPTVKINDQYLWFQGSIALNDWVEVDTRLGTVLDSQGRLVYGVLDPRTVIRKIRLTPGRNVITVTSGSTDVVRGSVSWRSAWPL